MYIKHERPCLATCKVELKMPCVGEYVFHKLCVVLKLDMFSIETKTKVILENNASMFVAFINRNSVMVMISSVNELLMSFKRY